jgi:hypothetical protein
MSTPRKIHLIMLAVASCLASAASRPTNDAGPRGKQTGAVRSESAQLVTGPPERLQSVVAGTPPTAVMKVVPATAKVGSYPAGTTIVSNELTAITGGFRAWFEFKLSDWDPNGDNVPPLYIWQFQIDSSGYEGVNADPSNPGVDLAPPVITCANDAACVTAFGEAWARCEGGTCAPLYVDTAGTGRADSWCANQGCLAGDCVTTNVSYRCFAIGSSSGRPDAGIEYYGATVLLDIPAGALGKYTVNLLTDATFLADTSVPPIDIPTLAETGFVVNIVPRPCTGPGDCPDDGIFCNGPESCNLTTGSCQGGYPCSWGQVCYETTNVCLNFGACCLQMGTVCFLTNEPDCVDPPPNGANGQFLGAGSWCPTQIIDVAVPEGNGTVFIHRVRVPADCPAPGPAQVAAACPPSGPYTDAWVTPATGARCHSFNPDDGGTPIPGGFFGPGSDAFSGSVCLKGRPLGLPQYGDADTLISRSADPFDRCALPSGTQSTVSIEVVALSLESVDPIIVTYNGGPTSETWKVTVDLSSVGQPPGTLTATKSHCNGGEYTSVLYVQPRFTFTKVGNPGEVRVLDTGMTPPPVTPPVELVQSVARSWVSDIDPFLGAMVDRCSDFHANIAENDPLLQCDCNGNSRRDLCDIEDGVSLDCNANRVPDSCDVANATSQDVNGNGVPDECESTPNVIVWDPATNPTPWPNTNPLATTRSLAFKVVTPGPPGPSKVDALKVCMVDLQNPVPPNAPQFPPQNFSAYEKATCTAAGETNGCCRWVGPWGTFYESQGPPLAGPSMAARLQCTPYYWDWKSKGPIWVVGAEIMPSSQYSVQTYSAACMGNEATCANVSTPVTMYTRRSGDVEAPYNPPTAVPQPNAIDLTQVVNKFKSVVGAPVKSRAQLQPNLPELNADINAIDIVTVVDAISGKAYPYAGPCPCPSRMACRQTPCATPAVCVALPALSGGGPGAMCVKTCVGGLNDRQPCGNIAHCPGGTGCGAGGPTPGFCRDKCGRCNKP